MRLLAPCFPAVAGLALLAAAGGCRTDPPRGERQEGPLLVVAASDLKFAFDQLLEEFRRRHPAVVVTVSYGSSGNFYSQLMHGAPADLYLSADVEYPRRLARQGRVLEGSEFVYGVGRLAVWVPAASTIDVERLGAAALLDPSVRHVAIANPAHAPYGRAAASAIRHWGMEEALRDKLVFGENVTQALQFVQSRNAQIGVVALSLALAPPLAGQGRYWLVPVDAHPPLEQAGVILKASARPEAAGLLRDYLRGREGRAVLRRFGFVPPGE